MESMKKGIDYTGICVVFFCHDGDGNFVMARRSENARDEHGVWDIGGGGLEFGENVEDNLKKEIKEEYSTDVIEFEFLGYRDVHRTHEGKKTHWISLDFKVFVDKKKVANGEPHKFSEIGWFTLNDLPKELHSELPKFFEIYGDRIE
jgi:ADP-ribose pyrophosphatase YjhB (NUDIX family)